MPRNRERVVADRRFASRYPTRGRSCRFGPQPGRKCPCQHCSRGSLPRLSLRSPPPARPRRKVPIPNRFVRLVVPFAAATSPDVVMRIASPHLSEIWGQQMIIENRAGASGNLGAQAVASARAGRIHGALHGQLGDLREPAHVLEDAVRSAEELRAGVADREPRLRAGGEERAAGEEPAGADRDGEGGARQADLQLRRAPASARTS